jgi:hypothetical protein
MNKKEILAKLFKKRQELALLKAQLAATDYKAIKYAEGLYTDTEYASTKAEREAIRVQIRELSDLE